MMNIQVHADFSVSGHLQQLIEEKVGKLETYFDRIICADIYLKTEDNRSQQSLEETVEINMQVPGQLLHTEAHSDTFEKSLAEATEKMRRQLIKHKELVNPHI